MPEQIIADFSGGMNASVAVDKLGDKECLLAENVRFDEQGNVLISGANTAQNVTALTAGTSSAIHSLFFDQAIGGIAGVGTAIFAGARLATLSTSTTATNPQSSKMSFGIAPNRVYMDIGGTGYWMNPAPSNLITVDWAPPSVAGATVNGPNRAGTGTASGTGQPWGSPNNITSTNTGISAVITNTDGSNSNILYAKNFSFAISASAVSGITVSLDALVQDTPYFEFDPPHTSTIPAKGTTIISVTLLKNGIPTGSTKTRSFSWPGSSFEGTIVLGGTTDLWGTLFAQSDINSANFGFQVTVSNSGTGIFDTELTNGRITVYQGAGFSAGTGTTGTLTGTYTYKVTFAASSGEESDASNASTAVVLSGQQGTLTSIPTGDARTASRNVYRKGGILTAYYLVGNIADNTTTTYSDNQTDIAALTEAVILAGDTIGDEPNTRLGNQAVKYPTYHYDRVFWANGNNLIWSKPLNGFAYPADFSQPVGDSKDITGILSLGGELIIFKSDGIWRFTGTDENSFQLARTLSAVGTDWPFTIVAAGGSTSGFYFTGRIIFANRQGIWTFNGYNSSKISTKLDLWFRQDDKTGVAIRGVNGFHVPEIINSAATMLYQAAASAGFYRLIYAESGHSTNNAMLVLDLERGNITKRPFAAGSLAVDSVSNYFYAGSQTGFIVQLDDWNAVNDGLGNPVNMDFQTKYYDLKLRGSKFAVWGVEFLLNTSGQIVTPYIYFDEGTGTPETLGIISNSAAQRVFRKLTGINSRSCRNFSVRLNASSSLANSSGIPAIQLNHIKIYFEPRQSRARTGEG